MSQGAVKATAAERKAQQRREDQAHQAKLQRQALDWLEVVKPKRGEILVLRVPDDKFVYPGTKAEDVTPEQDATMRACHEVLGIVIQSALAAGVKPGGAAILGESMSLESLPPPPAPPSIPVARPKILLPPGTKV